MFTVDQVLEVFNIFAICLKFIDGMLWGNLFIADQGKDNWLYRWLLAWKISIQHMFRLPEK